MASDSRAKVADFIEISGEFTALNSSCPNAKKRRFWFCSTPAPIKA